jgi:hypothetical protein
MWYFVLPFLGIFLVIPFGGGQIYTGNVPSTRSKEDRENDRRSRNLLLGVLVVYGSILGFIYLMLARDCSHGVVDACVHWTG